MAPAGPGTRPPNRLHARPVIRPRPASQSQTRTIRSLVPSPSSEDGRALLLPCPGSGTVHRVAWSGPAGRHVQTGRIYAPQKRTSPWSVRPARTRCAPPASRHLCRLEVTTPGRRSCHPSTRARARSGASLAWSSLPVRFSPSPRTEKEGTGGCRSPDRALCSGASAFIPRH